MNNPFVIIGDILGYLHDTIKASLRPGEDAGVRVMARRPDDGDGADGLARDRPGQPAATARHHLKSDRPSERTNG